MHKNYKNLILDFDGVLADSSSVMLEAINFSFAKLSIPIVSKDEFRSTSKIEILRSRNLGKIRTILVYFLTRKYISRQTNKISLFGDFIK